MLQAEGVGKRFGPVTALEGVSIEFRPGEVHAVLGENGAGKSTLMNLLGGYLRPDSGEVTKKGVSVDGVEHAQSLGIQMVHQHFMLVPAFTVAENLALSALGSPFVTADAKRLASRALDIAEGLGWSLDPSTRTGDLPVGTQQRLEIVKALATEPEVLILDEPTAALSGEETTDLFRVLTELRGQGRTVILITHKLDEALAVSDRISVLRQGRLVETAPAADVDSETLVSWMLGEVGEMAVTNVGKPGEVVLSASELRVNGDRSEEAVRGVSFEVRSGEVLGIGGVDGNGQMELAEALVGIRPFSGQRSAPKHIGYIPQDRRHEGLALEMSVLDNLEIGLQTGFFIWPPAARERARQIVEHADIRLAALDAPVGSLSGGNQQKVVLARTLAEEPKLIVAVNPTRGLDVGAANIVLSRLRQAAAGDAAVVLFSFDRDELQTVATRTLYMSSGRLFASESEALQGGVA